ncbi:putative protease Do-like 14 [Ananas comosus]|uniref:Protease Do-like 14 n=1 Tax=Ananas comosus TaxID=4615 RepID=A0A6P5GU45_ANACO|nr:putative protease Do-like 14 [Ananas comosus]
MPISPEVARDLRETTKPTLGRHSNKFILVPGDKVVAVGRYHTEGYDLMVAPGIFSADCCRLDCKELFRANCKITKSGIGGPLLNLDGEVIGINFIGRLCTPFLPMNIVSRWWTHFKRHGQFCRPWIRVETANLFSGRVDVLEHIVRKFPNFSKGVIVEKVEQGSPADIAGINPNDVIVQCDGKKVKNFLGLFKKFYKKVGQAVELEVIRPHDGAHLTVSVFVSECTLVNRWPLLRGSPNLEEKTSRIDISVIVLTLVFLGLFC